MKKFWKRWDYLFVLSFVLIFLSACGMSKEVLEHAKGIPDKIQAAKSLVNDKQAKFEANAKTEGFVFFAPYAKREKWTNFFGDALTQLNHQEQLYNKEMKPLLDKNKSDSEHRVRMLTSKYLRGIRKASQLAFKPEERMSFLQKAKEKAPEWIATADENQTVMDDMISKLNKGVAKGKKDYPEKTEGIQSRYAPVVLIATSSAIALADAHKQLDLVKAGKLADYAIIGDNTKLVGTNLKKLIEADKKFRSTLKELYQSYVKILTDQKTKYFVQIGRTSWNNASDGNTEKNYIYPKLREVDEATYNYFGGLGEKVLYAYPTGKGLFGGTYGGSGIGNQWNKLSISVKEAWPSRSHDAAEFWVSDVVEKYYHKYIILKGDQKEETDWVEVSEADFDEHYDDLGQEIVSKPYGVFEDEKLETSAPAGMSLVGNPAYGEWQKDTRGDSFWVFYGKYALFRDVFFGPSWGGYYYSDWDRYNRGYRGSTNYYGKNPMKPKYGTAGSWTNTSPRMKNNHFAKRRGFKNARADFIKSRAAAGATKGTKGSVRGAGPASRNKGPGKGK